MIEDMTAHKRTWRFPWKKILLGLLALFFLFVGAILVWASFIKLPDISVFEARVISNSSKITDRTGQIVLYDAHQSVKRTQVTLAQTGYPIQKAVISIEDQDFYNNDGIRPTSIIRAALINITHASYVQGGSTITQQVIKNTLLTNDKTIGRKLREWILAIRLTRQFSKDQILEIYLNDAPLGGTIYGVEQAAESYYGIHSDQMDYAQAAYLAAMLPAPTYYSPFGLNKAALDARKNLVLEKMKQYGYITETELTQAENENVVFNTNADNGIKAPHFVFYILQQLEAKYGKDVIDNGGYTIKTTLDYDLQQKAEQMVAANVATNEKLYNASNSGLVAIDPTTGEILAMVGSRNYFDTTIDGAFNVTTAPRQPGSSFKPFVYSTAFEDGYTPDTVVFDVPTEFSTDCTSDGQPLPGYTQKNCYHPSNFDGKFVGPISLRDALAQSRDIPAVKMEYLVGVQNAINTAHSLGITTLNDPSQYGLSLVLGGGEVTLLDMTGAYGVFANSGVRNPTTGILEVDDSNGNVVEQYQPSPTQVMDKNVTLTLNDVLSDATARIPTFGTTLITIPGVAVKTGTTNDDRDAWCIGYTPSIAVGVWSGNDDDTPMTNGGSAISGPTWKEFMEYALTKYPSPGFEAPLPDPNYNNLKPILRGVWMGNDTVNIDKVTGLLATSTTPAAAIEQKVITDVHDILYWVNKSDPQGPVPTDPNSDPEYHLWEPPVEAWWAANQANYTTVTDADIPTASDPSTADSSSPLTITGLNSTMNTTDTANIVVSTTSQNPLTSVDVLIDGNYVATLPPPFHFDFNPSSDGYTAGTHTLTFNATNNVYATSTIQETVTLQ